MKLICEPLWFSFSWDLSFPLFWDDNYSFSNRDMLCVCLYLHHVINNVLQFKGHERWFLLMNTWEK